MKTELVLDSGKWLELETVEDGDLVQKVGQTAIGMYFSFELRDRIQAETGFSPTRFFAFQNHEGAMPVMLAVGENNTRLAHNGKHITGFQNRDPFPDFTGVIQALGEHLGIELDERHYYGRIPSRSDDEPSGPRP